MTKSHFFFISWSSSINQLPVSSSCSFLANTKCEILLVPGLRITSWGDIKGKNSHISCLANSISSGTARMLTNPLRNTTKTLLAPQRRADVAQSKAVSPALVWSQFWSTVSHNQHNVDCHQKNGSQKTPWITCSRLQKNKTTNSLKKGISKGSLAFMQDFKFVNSWFRILMSRTCKSMPNQKTNLSSSNF